MQAKRRLIEEEISDIEQLHPEISQKKKCDSPFSPLTYCDLAEDLLSSKTLADNTNMSVFSYICHSKMCSLC